VVDDVVLELQARPASAGDVTGHVVRPLSSAGPCLLRVIHRDGIQLKLMSVMTLLDAHLEQISLCALSISELPYATFMKTSRRPTDGTASLRPRYSRTRCSKTMILRV
jgi:hypothetical protein